MKAPALRHILALFFFLPVLLLLLWLFAVPEDLLLNYMIEKASGAGYTVKAEGFKKGFFLSASSEKAEIIKGETPLITITDVSVRANPLYIFLLKLRLGFAGSVRRGSVSGWAVIEKGGASAHIRAKDIEIADIPVLEKAGGGTLEAEASFSPEGGDARFSVSNAKLKNTTVSGAPLPLGIFSSVKGSLNFRGSTVYIDPVSLEGKGVYARLKGTIEDKNADLRLEIMPEHGIIPDYLATALIGRFKVSPGYFVIKIKTTLRL